MPDYAEIPEFGQFVEYVTQAEPVTQDGELHYGVIVNQVRLADLNIVEGAECLLEDYQKVAALQRPVEDLPDEEVEAIKSQVLEIYHSDIASLVTVTANPIEIVSAAAAVKSYPEWEVGIPVEVGEVYFYNANLYQVIQAHTTQSDWDPVTAKALYKRYYEPDDDPWEWVQPAGSHDVYPAGVRVLHNGKTWQSEVENNSWEPGVYGWKDLTPAPEYEEWIQPTGARDAYQTGDRVIFEGHLWRSKIDANVYSPAVYPAGWEDLGVYP